MAERINKEELRNVLVRNFEMTEEQAANVLERFFGLIIKALETDRYVKVKGLGIFKLIDVEPHRIVNVNTGESVDTQGYKKVAFVPDATLKEVVNKPFAHFETVALRDGVGIEDVKCELEAEELQQDDFPLQVLASVGTSADQQAVGVSEEQSREDRVGQLIEKSALQLVEDSVEQSAEASIEQSFGKDMSQGMEEKKSETNQILISRRKELRELERQMDYEESRSRVAMGIIAVLLFLFVLCGLLFLLAPDFLEKILF